MNYLKSPTYVFCGGPVLASRWSPALRRCCAQTETQTQSQANPSTTWTVNIVLPPRVMAGHPATLAVFGVDGKLAAGRDGHPRMTAKR